MGSGTTGLGLSQGDRCHWHSIIFGEILRQAAFWHKTSGSNEGHHAGVINFDFGGSVRFPGANFPVAKRAGRGHANQSSRDIQHRADGAPERILGDRIVMDKRVKAKTADAFPGPHDYKVDNPPLDPLFSEEIDYLIRMIRMREIYAIELMLEPLGLTVSAWLPLAALRIEDGMSQRELGVRLNLKDAGIGQSVDALEKAGLVVREKDLNDRRKALVCLTPDGRKMANKVAKMRAKFQSAVVDGFSEAEKDMFRDMLQRSYLNIGALINASKQAGGGGGAKT